MILDEELQGDGLPDTWNFLKQNALSISRNPFEALRKLGGVNQSRIISQNEFSASNG